MVKIVHNTAKSFIYVLDTVKPEFNDSERRGMTFCHIGLLFFARINDFLSNATHNLLNVAGGHFSTCVNRLFLVFDCCYEKVAVIFNKVICRACVVTVPNRCQCVIKQRWVGTVCCCHMAYNSVCHIRGWSDRLAQHWANVSIDGKPSYSFLFLHESNMLIFRFLGHVFWFV